MWVPFVLLLVLIAWMYHVIAHRPGGQPIAALERAFEGVAKWVRGLFPKAQRV